MSSYQDNFNKSLLLQLRRIADELERHNNLQEQSLRLTEQALNPQREFSDRPPYPSSNIDQG